MATDEEYGDEVDFSELLDQLDTTTAHAGAGTSRASSGIAASINTGGTAGAGGSDRAIAPAQQPRPGVVQPTPQALPGRAGPSSIFVSSRQRGNPILNYVKRYAWEYADIPADYVVGRTTCVLFLSLKYHRLHPEYIYSRIKLLGSKFQLRLLLTMVDIPNHEESLRELSKTSIINDLTLILCWSAAEAGHYLELFKACEHAQPTAIRTQQAQSYKESLEAFVTAPRAINKSDAASLISTFGSLRNAINARADQIINVPGWGDRKVKQWCNAVIQDFKIERGVRSTGHYKAGEARDIAASSSMTSKVDRRGAAAEERSLEEDDPDLMRAIAASLAQTGDAARSPARAVPGSAEVPESSGSGAAQATNRSDKRRAQNEELSDGIAEALKRLRRG
ncbi:ssDNA endonuclease and repair protein rad10 [Ascosphaera acerosa]|nr:ssDNA endonuclease and repair protein rad10 [Ascosphaera acerosa]